MILGEEGHVTVSDVGQAPGTRVRCIYDLAPRLRLPPVRRLGDVADYGRFRDHVDAATRLLPQVAYSHAFDHGGLCVHGGSEAGGLQGRVSVLVTPRHDALLVLDVELPGEPDAREIVRLLAASCFDRSEITVDGQPILGWLSSELSVSVRFGRNVHQCVFPAGALREELLAAGADPLPPAVTSMIYRGTVSPDRGGRLGVRIPDALTNPGETLVAHGRGVSLIVGYRAPVENVLALAAATMVAAMGVLHRARDLAYDALALNQAAQLESTAQARELVSRLSSSLNEVQLDLSFGVEAYVDSVLIPEMVVDSFQASMREATALDAGLANTSRMVDRLGTVIHARAAALDAASQDESERRGRVFNVMLALGSLIALPPTLLLAFFSVTSPDVDPAKSILDLGRYWMPYALAWLPFAALLLAGFVLRRRIRARPRLMGLEDPQLEVATPATLPSPRAADRQSQSASVNAAAARS